MTLGFANVPNVVQHLELMTSIKYTSLKLFGIMNELHYF